MAKPDSVWNRVPSVILRRFVTLWSAAAWPYVAMAICFLTSAFLLHAHYDPSERVDPIVQWHSMGVFAKLGFLLAYLVCISVPHGLAVAGNTMVVWGDLQGQRVDLGSVFSRIGQVLSRLVILSLCIGSMCVFASLFFFVPGILVFAFISFTIPVLVIEDANVSIALRRGIKLASTRIGALLGLYAVVLFVIVVVAATTMLVAFRVNCPWWVGIIAFWVAFVALASILIMGTTTMVVHLYRDVCEQR